MHRELDLTLSAMLSSGDSVSGVSCGAERAQQQSTRWGPSPAAAPPAPSPPTCSAETASRAIPLRHGAGDPTSTACCSCSPPASSIVSLLPSRTQYYGNRKRYGRCKRRRALDLAGRRAGGAPCKERGAQYGPRAHTYRLVMSTAGAEHCMAPRPSGVARAQVNAGSECGSTAVCCLDRLVQGPDFVPPDLCPMPHRRRPAVERSYLPARAANPR
jgi:hypothetical protein